MRQAISRGAAVLLLLSCMGLSGPARAQGSVEDRLAEYEKATAALRAEVEALRKEVAELRATRPAPPPVPPGAQTTPAPAKGPSTPAPAPRAQIFGYLQAQFEDGLPGGSSRFLVRRTRLGVRGQLERDFAYEIQAELATGSNMLRNAWIDYTGWRAGPWSPALRIGQFKLPYSLEAIESSSTLAVIERALVVEQLAGTHDRDTGVQLFGKADPRRPYAYQLSVTNGAGRNQFAATQNKLFAGRLQLNTPSGRTLLGGALAAGISTRQGHVENLNLAAGQRNEDERYGLDVDYLGSRWHLRGEYLRGRNDRQRPRGYYGLAAYRLRPDLELVGRYEGFSSDAGAGGDAAHRTTLGANYFFSKNTKAMLGYEFLHGRAPNDLRSGVRFRLQTLFP